MNECQVMVTGSSRCPFCAQMNKEEEEGQEA